MLTLEGLRTYGANVQEGLGRCMNNEGFYLRLVGMALADPHFAELQNAVAAGDLKKGFEAAHALKGVLGNLSLTPLYNPVSEITELLRSGTQMDYTPYLQTINEKYQALVAMQA